MPLQKRGSRVQVPSTPAWARTTGCAGRGRVHVRLVSAELGTPLAHLPQATWGRNCLSILRLRGLRDPGFSTSGPPAHQGELVHHVVVCRAAPSGFAIDPLSLLRVRLAG